MLFIFSCKQKENCCQITYKESLKNQIDLIQGAKIVFVSPDSTKLDSLSKKISFEELYKNVETNEYYSKKFKIYLKQRKLAYTQSNKRYVAFVSNNNDTLVFDTQKVQLNWFLLIFDGYNFPTYISNISIPED